MNKKKIFLATPISAFKDNIEYQNYRKSFLNFVDILKKSFEVFSEIELMSNLNEYDSPLKSVLIDFQKIDESDFFILHHPKQLQSSTLIELGYAFAKNKKIIIIANKTNLPYLVIGMSEYSNTVQIIDDLISDKKYINKIFTILEEEN